MPVIYVLGIFLLCNPLTKRVPPWFDNIIIYVQIYHITTRDTGKKLTAYSPFTIKTTDDIFPGIRELSENRHSYQMDTNKY